MLDNSESQGAAQFTPGIYEYVTVFSREPNTVPGTTQSRINILTGSAAISSGSSSSTARAAQAGGSSSSSSTTPTTLETLLSQMLAADRARGIQDSIAAGTSQEHGPAGSRTRAAPAPPSSVLDFYIRGKLTAAELDTLTPYLTIGTGQYKRGLINVNTASATVLACVPGITPALAQQIVSARQTQGTPYTNLAWLVPILGNSAATQAGPYLTTESFQVSADVAAVGPGGRGYRRTLFVFDGEQRRAANCLPA